MEIGLLFPAGGRVEPAQMIGRIGDVHNVVEHLRERVDVALVGPRRIGKTTVCNAACDRLRDEHGFLVIEVETPEQSTAAGFCELVAARYARDSLTDEARAAGKVTRSMLETALEHLSRRWSCSWTAASSAPSSS
jgi:Ni2+-binding GTPase involved in maturation of urease and hydrogenase